VSLPLEGQVPNVVFVEVLVRDGGRWWFYDGGADRSVGVAEALARGPKSSRAR
jgi:predicted GH43/DUF377 family glycosyl hydrolase